MPVKTIHHPATGQIFALGRNKPLVLGPRLSLKNYLGRKLAPAPDCDWTKRAMRSLLQMYLNGTTSPGVPVLGCCVIAWLAHMFGIFNENAGGNPSIFTDAEIMSQYSLIGGYVPGDPSTDNGCDEVTALNHALQHGFTGHHFAGYLAVDGTDKEEVRQAVWLFENLMFGMNLPDAWISPFPSSSGFLWDVAGPPNPDNGHCPGGCGTNGTGVLTSTWAMVGTTTYDAIAQYTSPSSGGSLYTVLSAESLRKAILKAPNGFDFTQLVADFQAIGGSIGSLV
jgi:hypothetical protein